MIVMSDKLNMAKVCTEWGLPENNKSNNNNHNNSTKHNNTNKNLHHI